MCSLCYLSCSVFWISLICDLMSAINFGKLLVTIYSNTSFASLFYFWDSSYIYFEPLHLSSYIFWMIGLCVAFFLFIHFFWVYLYLIYLQVLYYFPWLCWVYWEAHQKHSLFLLLYSFWHFHLILMFSISTEIIFWFYFLIPFT